MIRFTAVSVVIPTIGRPELARAVRSAREQIGGFDIEVIVVNDAADPDAAEGTEADAVIWTGGGRRGGHARNRGVAASHGDFVAFLDDDDEWEPTKLRDQMKLVKAATDPSRLVVSGRHVHVSKGSQNRSAVSPARVISPAESVAHYLFRRRQPAVSRASMYTSTLLCSRALASGVPWQEDLPRHQDWDWLVRLGEIEGVTFAHAPSVVARIQVGSVHSISASADWMASKRWADERLDDDRVYVDFLFGQTLRYALSARSGKGVTAVARAAAQRRVLPSIGPVMLGLAGLIPRESLERLMAGSRPRRPLGAGSP